MSAGITCSGGGEILLVFDDERVVSLEELKTVAGADEAVALGVPALLVINYPGQWRGTEFLDWLRTFLD